MSPGVARDLRTRRFWSKLTTHTFTCIGFVAVVLGLYDVIEPNAVSHVKLPMGPLLVACSLLYGTARAWPRPVEQQYSKPNTQIRVVEGDLFDQPGNLVIGMSNTFDTEVPHIIHTSSVQGQFLARIFSHDRTALDQELDKALAGAATTGTLNKDGKQTTYVVGTVAVIRDNRRHYFCVAYSSMDEQNQAHGSMDGIWQSLGNLWDEVRTRTNGDPVAIPVIGGGLTRLSQILPAQDSIRFIALSFMFASRRERVCDRLDIVVRKDDVQRLDMLELQAFLKSLQES